MRILFQNENIVVTIKPVGVSSQESTGDNMVDSLKQECGCKEIYPVHRLDTVTSGLMVYAKTKFAAAFFAKEIAENRFHKTYIAKVHGMVSPENGTMEDFLFKDSRKNKSFVVKRERKGVKKAILNYETIKKSDDDCSFVKIELVTGRTHQIRVQFSSRGNPVFGDGKYGASDNVPFIYLFSSELRFKDPQSKQMLCFSENPEWLIL